MSRGVTCYERDEDICEDEMCFRVGCVLRNARLAKKSAGELLWPPNEMAELLDALARSADGHTNSYSETAHLCRNGAETIRRLCKQNEEAVDSLSELNRQLAGSRYQLGKAKLALEECCHMAGAPTEHDAEDWLNSIREYAKKQLLALTDDLGEAGK